MALKHCNVCGEKYSDTYNNCPFCEEERDMTGSRSGRRRSSKRTSSRKDPGILTPMLIALILALSLILVYLFFGEAIREKIIDKGRSDPATSQSSSSSGAENEDTGSSSALETDNTDGGAETEDLKADLSALPDTLKLSNTDYTTTVGDPTVKLTVENGNGTYTWVSEDDGIASVDENGVVTAISMGMVHIYATDGNGKGECIVRVKAGTAGAVPAGGEVQSSGETVKLNRDDFTMGVGESFQLKSSGDISQPSWTSDKPSVATVSSDGTVTGVSSGLATITMSYDGKSLNCIVRVK